MTALISLLEAHCFQRAVRTVAVDSVLRGAYFLDRDEFVNENNLLKERLLVSIADRSGLEAARAIEALE